MIRPRTGFAAPSQSTLNYLRQLVFPHHGGGGDFGISNRCLRAPSRQQRTQYSQRCIHSANATGLQGNSDNTDVRSLPRPPSQDCGSTPATPTVSSGSDPDSATAPAQPQTAPSDDGEDPEMEAYRPYWDIPINPIRLTSKESQPRWMEFKSLLEEGELKLAKDWLMSARMEKVHEFVIQKAGIMLMTAYNRLEKHAEAPSIFHYLAMCPDYVDCHAFNLCLEAYLIRKDYFKFIKTFKHHISMKLVEPDHKTYELFVKCLVKTGNIDEARTIMKMLESERKPITLSTFAAFLAGVRDKTASFTELQKDFAWIKTRKQIVAPALYNIMIEEALVYGKPSVAKGYVDEMIESGVKPDERTFAAFLRVQSAAGDWGGVRKAMAQVAEKGMKFSAMTLNSFLDKYADIQGLNGLEEFFDILSIAAPDRFPTPASFNIMIRAHLTALDERGVMRWVARMRQAGFEPTATTFNTFLHDLRCSDVPSSMMYQVYYTVFNRDRNKVDEFSREILRRSVSPIKKTIEPPPLEPFNAPEGQKGDSVVQIMQAALQHGRVGDALNAFRDASAHIPIYKDVIAVLSRAYMQLPNDELDIPAVVSKDRDRAVIIKDSVVGYMIELVKTETEKTPVVYSVILQIMYGVYKFLEANDMTISHNIAHQVATALINRADAVGALHIMNEVAKTRWGRREDWDIAGLTVLLQSYLILNDIRGVRWVVNKLAAGREVADSRFVEYLKRVSKSSSPEQYKQEIRELLKTCMKHREKARKATNKRAAKVADIMDDKSSVSRNPRG
ncbi:hypothetical protein FN846DRAFT_941394 [Sphaerosporella brunnea]|uniref:Pentacotripeptide-repeat region of PRORP domain-containing protein n=1 Tax=Sphaerosporella brunnea TaxID=1250544 RepID=A0A5J5F1P5_9PEZI|nr:hypothetical protein FN846DRAFT_941394 [Sphaerosporella brunnea]